MTHLNLIQHVIAGIYNLYLINSIYSLLSSKSAYLFVKSHINWGNISILLMQDLNVVPAWMFE